MVLASHLVLDQDFTMEELHKVLAHAKNNKAARPDNIQNEFVENMSFNWKIYSFQMNRGY